MIRYSNRFQTLPTAGNGNTCGQTRLAYRFIINNNNIWKKAAKYYTNCWTRARFLSENQMFEKKKSFKKRILTTKANIFYNKKISSIQFLR